MTPSSSITTPTPGASVAPSTKPGVQVGDVVLVRLDPETWRPLLVACVHPDGSVSGGLTCADGDHERVGLRGWERGDAQIQGRPSWHVPIAYGRHLLPGERIGEWRPRG